MGNNGNVREVWIDNEKGLFLILIVLGHLGSIPSALGWLLAPTDLLYVPAFFFLSGWLFDDSKYSLKSFFFRKLRSLFIPYLAISLLVSLFDWNLYLHTAQYVKDFLVSFLMGDGVAKASPLWFVSTLFVANLLLKIGCVIKEKRLRAAFFLSLPFICYYLYFSGLRLPFRADSALGACFIMYVSQMVKRLSLNTCCQYLLFGISSIFLALGLYLKLGLLNYNTVHSVMSFPCAVGGCVSASFAFSKLRAKYFAPPSPLLWIARNGLPVLGFHCLLAFYVDVPFKLLKMDSADFLYFFKVIIVFSLLYLVVVPFLKKYNPRWWGL